MCCSRLIPVVLCGWLLASHPLWAADSDGTFSKLQFLKGKWTSTFKVADGALKVSDLTFDVILQGKFLQLSYSVTRDSTVKTHQVIVGPGQDGLKAWTFTSDGKSYESTVQVEKRENGCVVKATTGKESVVVTFTKTEGGGFSVNYENAARKLGPITATFQKSQ